MVSIKMNMKKRRAECQSSESIESLHPDIWSSITPKTCIGRHDSTASRLSKRLNTPGIKNRTTLTAGSSQGPVASDRLPAFGPASLHPVFCTIFDEPFSPSHPVASSPVQRQQTTTSPRLDSSLPCYWPYWDIVSSGMPPLDMSSPSCTVAGWHEFASSAWFHARDVHGRLLNLEQEVYFDESVMLWSRRMKLLVSFAPYSFAPHG